MSVYDISVNNIRGEQVSLDQYRGKVMLIVNTASKCGFTPQYKGLEALHKDLQDQGLSILGFPCNQFGGQEPGSESEISEFCELNFGVSFELFKKIDVNGDNESELYTWLKSQKAGLLGSKRIKWNFTKFLINANGEVVGRYAPTAKPEDIRKDIEALLA